MIGGGRTSIRNVLYMAARSAIRHNPVVSSLYQRFINQGRPKKSRHHRRPPTAPDHPQRNRPNEIPVENRLTRKTVAHARSKNRASSPAQSPLLQVRPSHVMTAIVCQKDKDHRSVNCGKDAPKTIED
jgi:hypothetical protein